jgi:hypothetical protein
METTKKFDVNEVSNDIKKCLNQLASIDYIDNIGNRKWTAYILTHLKKLGHEYGFEVCPDDDNQNSGWLYDLKWYKNEDGFLTEIPFIMESEWSYNHDHIKYDFEKLLQAYAELKLMVCCCKREGDLEYFNEYFPKAIQKYKKQSASTYIFAILKDWEPFEFIFYKYNSARKKLIEDEKSI